MTKDPITQTPKEFRIAEDRMSKTWRQPADGSFTAFSFLSVAGRTTTSVTPSQRRLGDLLLFVSSLEPFVSAPSADAGFRFRNDLVAGFAAIDIESIRTLFADPFQDAICEGIESIAELIGNVGSSRSQNDARRRWSCWAIGCLEETPIRAIDALFFVRASHGELPSEIPPQFGLFVVIPHGR